MPGTKRDGGRGKIEADLSERSLWEDQRWVACYWHWWGTRWWQREQGRGSPLNTTLACSCHLLWIWYKETESHYSGSRSLSCKTTGLGCLGIYFFLFWGGGLEERGPKLGKWQAGLWDRLKKAMWGGCSSCLLRWFGLWCLLLDPDPSFWSELLFNLGNRPPRPPHATHCPITPADTQTVNAYHWHTPTIYGSLRDGQRTGTLSLKGCFEIYQKIFFQPLSWQRWSECNSLFYSFYFAND